jgi:selT/selW/selH-like putative selenoprotein
LQTFGEWTDGIKLIPGDRGAFEVTVNGQQIYSKWDTKKFPELNDLKESIQKFVK